MDISGRMKTLYQALSYVDMISPGSGGGSSGGENYTAGTNVPITYNVSIHVSSQAFMGNEDDAKNFASLIGRYLREDELRI